MPYGSHPADGMGSVWLFRLKCLFRLEWATRARMETVPLPGATGRPWVVRCVERPGGVGALRGAGGLLAVLFDRDGTLVEDVPYNADPALVRPVPQARAALGVLRACGVATGVVSNQSAIARGWCSPAEAEAVRLRVEELLGPFDVWAVCPHAPEDGCRCRKPAPGLVYAACEALGVLPRRAAVVGDIGSDIAAARAAGARGVLVPTPATRSVEIDAAPERAPDLYVAVGALLAGPRGADA